VRITWTVEDLGGNAADADAVDDAASAFVSGIRALYEDRDTATLAHIMLNVVAPIRSELVTDGRFEVERGRTWEHTSRGIHVTLSPN
jgi:hypothetical protein